MQLPKELLDTIKNKKEDIGDSNLLDLSYGDSYVAKQLLKIGKKINFGKDNQGNHWRLDISSRDYYGFVTLFKNDIKINSFYVSYSNSKKTIYLGTAKPLRMNWIK